MREALVQLERTGLVTREANKGYRVSPPLAGDQLEALFDARLIVESGAVELAARGDVDGLRERLAAALDEQAAVAAEVASVGAAHAPEELMARFFRSDWQFHQLIFDATRNPFLEEMSEIITTRVHRMRQIVEGGGDDTDRAVQEHRAILEALAADPTSAVAAMRLHIDAVRLRSRADASHTS